jgi:hypothetical protein
MNKLVNIPDTTHAAVRTLLQDQYAAALAGHKAAAEAAKPAARKALAEGRSTRQIRLTGAVPRKQSVNGLIVGLLETWVAQHTPAKPKAAPRRAKS